MLLNNVNDNRINYVKSLYKILNGNTVLYEIIIDYIVSIHFLMII